MVIIGVIAAITVPSLINKLERNELRSQFNKAVSVASQAVQKLHLDYGDVVFDRNEDTTQTFRDRFRSYFNTVCTHNCVDTNKYKNLTNNQQPTELPSYMQPNDCFITHDGMLFCINKGGKTNDIYIFIDVNGLKKPNRLGYDTFAFYVPIDSQILKPSLLWSCNFSGGDNLNGFGCAKKAISEPDYFAKLP